MRKILIIISIIVLAAGCSGSIRENFPRMDPREPSARIVVFEEAIWVSAQEVVLDGFEVADVGPGEYVVMYVPPGIHAVGTKTGTVSLEFEPGQSYYFMIAYHRTVGNFVLGTGPTFVVERLREDEALPLIASYTNIGPVK